MFFKKNSESLSLLCDIGSASVGLALADLGQDKPVIHFVTRAPLTIAEKFDAKTLELAMVLFFTDAVKNLELALHETLSGLPNKHINSAILVFSSPWYAAKVHTAIIERETPFLLDEHTISALVAEEEKKFEKKALTGGYQNIAGQDVHMIERELVRVKLNGYETENPFLKRATNAELTLYMSLVPHVLLAKMNDLIRDRFHVKNFKAFTFPLVSFGAVGTLFPHESEYILLDIAGEMTDVSVVRENIIAGSQSFPSGRNRLIRAVSEKFGVLPEIAVSFISLHAGRALDDEMSGTMETLQTEFISTWKSDFLKTLSVLEGGKTDNNRIFVSVDEDVRAVFEPALSEPSDIRKFQVFILSGDSLDPSVTYDKHVIHDSFLALETIFFSRRTVAI